MKPAEMLEGQKLTDGWRVVKAITRKPTATGSNFSTGYLAEHEDGRRGFLKAMDYISALQAPNTAEILQIMTKAYLFEKQICESCREKRMNRVTHAIASGSINPTPANPAGKVEYLIFELAEGDIRVHLDAMAAFDLAFVLRTIHHVATGVQQLH